MWNPAGIINHILPLRCSETLHPPAENTALSVIWTLTQKSCSVLTERGGESRQLVVGVTVQRKGPRCDGTDETLVCCTPVRPAHPSHAAAGRGKCERDVNWTMPALYEVEVGGGGGGGKMDRVPADSQIWGGWEASRGGLSARVKATSGISTPLEYLCKGLNPMLGFTWVYMSGHRSKNDVNGHSISPIF